MMARPELSSKTGINQNLFQQSKTTLVDTEGTAHFFPQKQRAENYSQYCIGYSKSLTLMQIKAIVNKYTEHKTSFCSKLNLLLAADSPTLSEHGNDIRQLKTAIKQLALKNPVNRSKCFRGIECSEQEFQAYELDSQLYFPSFMSTSMNPFKSYKNEEINTYFIINLPEVPKNAFQVTSTYSKYASEEEEALFSCYSYFHIIKKDINVTINGRLYKYMVELEHINEKDSDEDKIAINEGKSMMQLLPFEYIHVTDINKQITYLVAGPQNFVKQTHEKFVHVLPQKFLMPDRNKYYLILNPVVINKETNETELLSTGEAKVHWNHQEYRFYSTHPQPFPLYPNEILQETGNLRYVEEALLIEAIDDTIVNSIPKKAGDQWIFEGPAIYYPNIAETVIEERKWIDVAPEECLHLKAKMQLIDSQGNQRTVGDEWIVKGVWSYLLQVGEELVGIETSKTITKSKSIQLKAKVGFIDVYGVARLAGQVSFNFLFYCLGMNSNQ